MDRVARTGPLREARRDELDAVARLMNRAYRDGAPGWNTEAGLIAGTRTTPGLLAEEVAGGALLLVWPEGQAPDGIAGCVRLSPEAAPGGWQLGGLAVAPGLQGAGRGARLLAAAEAVVRDLGGAVVRMSVIGVRTGLIDWYARRGYAPTGERRAFPRGDARNGRPLREDLDFVVLAKEL